MEYIILPPACDLKAYISHFWAGSWNIHTQSPNTRHIIIANSLLEITFAFANNAPHGELLFTTVQGATHQPGQYKVPGFYHLLGVSIYAHAAPALFGLPAAELNNIHLPVQTFLSSKARTLTERVALAPTTEKRVQILSDFFRTQLKRKQLQDIVMLQALQEMRQQHGHVRISGLARQSYLSQKQFYRRFKDFTGFNPKVLARIIRLEAVLKHYTADTSLTDMAHTYGYYDQAHFIHEFSSLTGFSPGDFWKLSAADGK